MADPGMITKIVFFYFILIILNSVQTAPTLHLKKEELKNHSDSENNHHHEEYAIIDQRQNGTENYRINVKDVVVIWAPANALLAASGLLDSQILGDFLEMENAEKPQSVQNNEKPELIVEIVGDKPEEQNNNVSNSTRLPEKQTTVVSTTENIAVEQRSFGDHFDGNLGPLFRRRFQRE